jgi:hypothetical protein
MAAACRGNRRAAGGGTAATCRRAMACALVLADTTGVAKLADFEAMDAGVAGYAAILSIRSRSLYHSPMKGSTQLGLPE